MARRPDATAPKVRIEVAGPQQWSALETLFEGRDGPHHCWCMVWRDMPTAERRDKTKKKSAFKARVDASVPVGLLAFADGAPVGWCAVGPRQTVPRLTKDRDPAPSDTVWTISCFFVQRASRASGITALLIDGALAYTRESGAAAIEAYPVSDDAPSYRFLGFVKHFARAGFTETGRHGRHRHIMRRELA